MKKEAFGLQMGGRFRCQREREGGICGRQAVRGSGGLLRLTGRGRISGKEGADGRVSEIGKTIYFTNEAFVDVGKFAVGLVLDISGSKVCGEGSAGAVSQIGRVSVHYFLVENHQIAHFQGHGAVFFEGGVGESERSHFHREVFERNPSGDHGVSLTGLPATAFPVPMIIWSSSLARFLVEELIVPEADLADPGQFAKELS